MRRDKVAIKNLDEEMVIIHHKTINMIDPFIPVSYMLEGVEK
jgi:hypothetical protein